MNRQVDQSVNFIGQVLDTHRQYDLRNAFEHFYQTGYQR